MSSRSASRPLAVATLAVAALVLVGWTIPPLSWLTSWGRVASAPPWTALMMGLLALRVDASPAGRRRAASGVGLLALVSLSLPGVVVTLQQVLWDSAALGPAPGVDVAACLLVAALWASTSSTATGLPLTFAAGAAAIANLSLLGKLTGADWLVAAGAAPGDGAMSLPSLVMILGLALTFWVEHRLDDQAVAGAVAPRQRLVAAVSAIVVPLGVLWLASPSELADREDYASTALLVVALTMATQLASVAASHRDALAAVERMLDASPDPMLFVDVRGRVVRTNQAVSDTFGVERDDVIGRPVTALLPSDRTPGGPRRRARPRPRVVAWAPGVPEGPVLARRADGSTFPAEVALSPVRLRGHTLVAATVRDATAHEEQVELLRGLQEMQAIFMTAVSHELRTPLTVVLGLSETLLEHGEQLDLAHRQDLLRRLSSNARRLNLLLGDLLDVDRLRRGVAQATTRLDVGRCVREQADLSAVELALDVTVDVEPDLPPVLSDRVLLARVLDNLLSNVAKYAPGPAEIHARRAPGGVVIVVDDHGPGVPERMRDQVFQPFLRGDRLDVATPGVGIGLSLVAGVADAARGRAWVQGRDDGRPGASFRVFLPAAPPPDQLDVIHDVDAVDRARAR